MKRGIIMCLLLVGVCSSVAYSIASGPMGVSPAVDGGEAVIGSTSPAFSWSSVEGAVGYRLEVYKAIDNVGTYQETAERSEPILRVDIPAPALSWSPSAVEALQTGEGYVWYVKAVDYDGYGQWSAGNRFRIEANLALSGMEEAVREKVREYVRTDTEIREAIREIKEEGSTQAGAGVIAVGTGESPEAGKLKGLEGDTNTFYGKDAGKDITSGAHNSFFGIWAGRSNTAGVSNTFVGDWAGHSNTTGYFNTFTGAGAGAQNAGAYGNTFTGGDAGHNNTDGQYNAFMGYRTGSSNINGSYNTFLGGSAGASNTSGSYNTFIGYEAGRDNQTGIRNVFMGYKAGYKEKSSNRLYIHNSDSSSPLIYGEFDNRVLKINGSLSIADVSSPSDISLKRNIQPLDSALWKIATLTGVSYNWRTEEYPDRGFTEDRQIGLIAQDVEKVLPELVRTGNDGKKSLSYDKLTAVLVEAIKAQQGEIKTQEKQIASQSVKLAKQQSELDAQATRIKGLENMMRKLASKAI